MYLGRGINIHSKSPRDQLLRAQNRAESGSGRAKQNNQHRQKNILPLKVLHCIDGNLHGPDMIHLHSKSESLLIKEMQVFTVASVIGDSS